MNYFGKYSVICALCTVAFIGKTGQTYSQEIDYKAYTIFLYNFMKYVEWPANDGDFIIGVAGESPVKKELEQLAKNKKAKSKKIVVISVMNPGDALLCNMVYIPSSKSSELKAISGKVKNRSVLIVAEREGLAKKGADISFVVDDEDALKFDINRSVMDSHNLKAAKILIELGMVVD